MKYTADEIVEVVRMLSEEDLDIRSVTLSVNTLFALSDNLNKIIEKLDNLNSLFSRFSSTVDKIQDKLGVRIVTKRIAVSPIQYFLEIDGIEGLEIAKKLDEMAEKNNIDYIGGYSAFVDRGFTKGSKRVIDTLSETMNSTRRITGMINAASTMSGINTDGVRYFTDQIFKMKPEASSRVTIMANVPPDSPFVPSAHHGNGMPEAMISVAVSGPGVIESAIRRNNPKNFQDLHDIIKRSAFKITRLGELIGKNVANELKVSFGSVDLSLAPSPKVKDSVAGIIEAMGIEKMGGHGSLMALAILMDAIKKGGSMATSSVGGLSSAFIPVSEDAIMSERASEGYIDFFTLLALSSVCNSGIDMVGISKKQGKDKVVGLIMDVLAMGITINKILGVRVIPLDLDPGSHVDLGGLLGKVVVMKLKEVNVEKFVNLGGFVPNTIKRLEMG
ncbi:DUF711 family protein [Acidianus manzaensis]|uniref:PFL family protein n=1 Tax=Acidianus manzaensis TaxID=282676 RepID=A0A1W6K0W5_9CREN|nr:DUF711 family protein [Acidianus manzaensis]ARM76173.1 PFL family protein [Acidianus manzaensis]